MKKAILFDMDGVIVDTEPLHHKAYFQMFSHFNLPVNEELYQTFTGQSTQNICNFLVENFDLKVSSDDLIQKKRAFFKHYFDNDPDFTLLPGVKDLIEYFFRNDKKLILASSASMNTINWVFDRFELHPFFKGKISGADLMESKPHPEIFIKAAEMAQEPIENCMVIEDSTNGIKAANAAGIYCVAYKSPHSKNQDYSLANQIIEQFAELMN